PRCLAAEVNARWRTEAEAVHVAIELVGTERGADPRRTRVQRVTQNFGDAAIAIAAPVPVANDAPANLVNARVVPARFRGNRACINRRRDGNHLENGAGFELLADRGVIEDVGRLNGSEEMF